MTTTHLNTTHLNTTHSAITETIRRLQPVQERLAELANQVDVSGQWPSQSIQACVEYGVLKWFLPESFGGWAWSDQQILVGYLGLSQSCLTTAFVLTQWHAAVRRILSSENRLLQQRFSHSLADASRFVTVGISQLSTSRQHTEAALRARPADGGFVLSGYAPWVTGASHADEFVLGATLEDGMQILALVPKESAGLTCHPGQSLIALTGSCTDRIDLAEVFVPEEALLAGPSPNVLVANASPGGGVGGLHTSILAIGHAMRAAAYLREESQQRGNLRPVADKLSADVEVLRMLTEQLTCGNDVISTAELRRRANSLVLRVTQAALQAAKGAGYVHGHPTGRWAREALFFLVWSCPQAVVEANLCDLAGIDTPA